MIDTSVMLGMIQEHSISDKSVYNGSIMVVNEEVSEFIDVDYWSFSKIEGYLLGKGYEYLLTFLLKEISDRGAQVFYCSDNGDIFKIESINRNKIIQFPGGGDVDDD